MTSPTEQRKRIVRQHLETSQLMGVDFLPVRLEAAAESPAAPATGSNPGAPSPAAAPDAAAIQAKAEALNQLRAEHDANCPHCTTATGHTQTVFGEGHPDARLMFIGEAPGAEEDRTGRPFVGRAGQKLDDMIRAMGLTRPEVYIGNILKSRPPGNRTPLAPEVAGCSPFLAEQIRIIEPEVIVALGGPAAKFLLQTEIGITRLRGRWSIYADGERRVDVMPTYHPAYILRRYTRETREQVWADLQAVMDRLGLVR
ncbi:MAG: uracil-DNA glycosylase [Planctomycetota bacterium]|nr:uracil-DNA glycosylase [Planctomycetota bacterium]